MDSIKDQLFKVLEASIKEKASINREIKSLILRYFPDRETSRRVEALVKGSKPAEIEAVKTELTPVQLTKADFQKKNLNYPRSVVPRGQSNGDGSQDLDDGREVSANYAHTLESEKLSKEDLLNEVNDLRQIIGERKLPPNTKMPRLIEELTRLKGIDPAVDNDASLALLKGQDEDSDDDTILNISI